MNQYVTGAVIKELREKKHMTQAEFAQKLCVSDKTVSKWETAKGYPDISLLEPIAKILGISITELISGNAISNVNISANMLRSKFYICPVCGNMIHSMGEAVMNCHGVQLIPLECEETDENHMILIEKVEDEYYIRIDHDMTKKHYISFVAGLSADKIQMIKLYPEGSAEARFKINGVKKILFYCNRDGLFSMDVLKGIHDKESSYDDYKEQSELEKVESMFNFNDKVVIVTGGAQGIGKCIVEEFEKAGAKVAIIDIKENEYFVGDLADKNTLENFVNKVISDYGKVDFLINNAAPKMYGISNGTYEDFEYSLRVGVTAPFYLAKICAPYFCEGASIVNISSSRDRMSQPDTESYTAAKGGISALTHALAVSFAGKVRVNSISPGWIENNGTVYEGADAIQHPVGRVGNPIDIANMVLYLCSEMSGFITGENICIDGGMTKHMIYHGDYGWSLKV